MNYRNMTLALVCIALAALTGCEPKPKEPKASAPTSMGAPTPTPMHVIA